MALHNKIVYFGYISFLREKVDLAKEILSARTKDYLWFCFDPSRIVQDGPANPHPNMSFSIILEDDDIDETVADIKTAVGELPFLSCVLVVENEYEGTRTIHCMTASQDNTRSVSV